MAFASPTYDKLLVLDLDETLIHATRAPLAREADFGVASFHVYRRPHLERFLAYVLERFRVGIWTSSSDLYARHVIRATFPADAPLAFIYTRERCTHHFDRESHDVVALKPLKKLRRFGYSPSHILAVDDSPEKWVRSHGNLVRVHPFEGDPHDDELLALSAYLDTLGAVPDVRPIEKRGWRLR
ncbi:MAG: NIF family HAD-type phosphatase [Sandaracinaceae bacterium]